MHTGLIFDIKEFAGHDGPGIRTTVFLKGCPLTCNWCHNPESQSSKPQLMHSVVGDERLVGSVYTPDMLATRLNKQVAILRANDGGITFSGGEPLMQAHFVLEVIERLDNLHVLLDTSGFASETIFSQVVPHVQLVYFDLKIIDSAMHQRFTGQDNALILRNLHALSELGVPYVIRVPLIPGVTDTDENLAAIARTIQGLGGLVRVDLLPYNRRREGSTARATWFLPRCTTKHSRTTSTQPFLCKRDYLYSWLDHTTERKENAGERRNCKLSYTDQCLNKRGDMGFNHDGGNGVYTVIITSFNHCFRIQ